MRTLPAWIAAGAFAFVALPASAQGIGRFVDAAHFPIDRSNNVYGLGGSSEQKLAQTLTVEVGGTLAGLLLAVNCVGPKLKVEIRDVDASGLPGPTLLAQRNVNPADFDAYGRFTYVPIAGALALGAGQQVSFVVSVPKGQCSYMPSPVGTDYPGGHGFFDARPNAPGWVPFSGFANTPDDLPFQLVLD